LPDEPKEAQTITAQDIEAVTEKFKEWVPTLPEQEQLVMGWILTRAAAAGDADVEQNAERAAGLPVSELMAEAVGLQEVSGHAASIDPIGPIWWFRWR
jgi:hypothetical protein